MFIVIYFIKLIIIIVKRKGELYFLSRVAVCRLGIVPSGRNQEQTLPEREGGDRSLC